MYINLVSIFNILKSALRMCAIYYLSNMALFFSFITPSSCNVFHSNVKKKTTTTKIICFVEEYLYCVHFKKSLFKKVECIDFVLI